MQGQCLSPEKTRAKSSTIGGAGNGGYFHKPLRETDPALFAAICGEQKRQSEQIELIASENFVSRAVLQAQGSVLTNKTVEGYPGARYYGGAEFADQIESLAIERAKKLFQCDYANVQPHSGSNANQAVYLACLQPGDTILSMDLAAGGHLSHGHPATLTGKVYRIVTYGLRQTDEIIDLDQVETLAMKAKPKLIIAGGSAYPRIIDFAAMRRIADKAGALLMVDMAHFAGLVATGLYPSPIALADVVTTTTYKSLRGARGGMILCNNSKLAKKFSSALFPGVQGSVMLHGVAGKAACLGEALQPEFKKYNQDVIDNAGVLAQALTKAGIRLVSNGTDTGLILADLRPLGLTGAQAVDSLERAGLTCNKNMVPFDPQPPKITSGLRFSSNAGTTRGFGGGEFEQIGYWIGEVLQALAAAGDLIDQVEHDVRGQVNRLCREFPVYADSVDAD